MKKQYIELTAEVLKTATAETVLSDSSNSSLALQVTAENWEAVRVTL